MTMHTLYRLVVVVWFGVSASVFVGCSTLQNEDYQTTGNPLLDLRNPDLLERDRIAAAHEAWTEVQSGVRVRERTRQAFKNLAWSSATSPDLRLTIIDLLMSDTTEEGAADSRRMARLLLPTEKTPAVVRVLCQRAGENGWAGLVPALVRSYSRVSPNVPDADRDERAAIQTLRPDKQIEEVIFETFLQPSAGLEDQQEEAVLRVAKRTRDDAWGLLGRLDGGTGLRGRLLQSVAHGADVDPETNKVLKDLRTSHESMGFLPNSAMELEWLEGILRNTDKQKAAANKQWWSDASSVIAKLNPEQRSGIMLRHLEPIRWASVHRQAWIQMDRASLHAVLADRLGGREHQKRKPQKGEQRRFESLQDWSGEMSWADILAVLVVDEAIMETGVVEQFFVQRDLDKKDTKTEYGGILDAHSPKGFRAVLFRPRERDRISDERFVASDDMMRFSDRALVHYHFHANDRDNSRYAGPSQTDMHNASLSGRTCVVLTSMGKREMNVDVYQPNGVVIDLGKIVK